MQGQKTLEEHEILVNRMAGTLGIDLDEAELRGRVNPETRAEMTLSCTGCADPGGCDRWLGENAKADQTPAYCRNSDLLASLRP
jgi:hypothetical protein